MSEEEERADNERRAKEALEAMNDSALATITALAVEMAKRHPRSSVVRLLVVKRKYEQND